MPTNDRLFHHLGKLQKDDLLKLLGTGLRNHKNLDKFEELTLTGLRNEISKQLRSAAGNTFINTFRKDHDLPYKQILIDVADKLSNGFTFLSWTDYKVNDYNTEEFIENEIIKLIEEKARKWWGNLPARKKGKITQILNDDISKIFENESKKFILTEQIIENIIQTGMLSVMSQTSATGLMGVFSVSILTQLGWTILVSLFGYMTAIKIALFGIGGMGALGNAVTLVGGAVISLGVAIPGLAIILSHSNYKKTIPTVILLLALSKR